MVGCNDATLCAKLTKPLTIDSVDELDEIAKLATDTDTARLSSTPTLYCMPPKNQT